MVGVALFVCEALIARRFDSLSDRMLLFPVAERSRSVLILAAHSGEIAAQTLGCRLGAAPNIPKKKMLCVTPAYEDFFDSSHCP